MLIFAVAFVLFVAACTWPRALMLPWFLFCMWCFDLLTIEGLIVSGMLLSAICLYVLVVLFICEQLRRLETPRTRGLIAALSLVIAFSGPAACAVMAGKQFVEIQREGAEMEARMADLYQQNQANYREMQIKSAAVLQLIGDYQQSLNAIVEDAKRQLGPVPEGVVAPEKE